MSDLRETGRVEAFSDGVFAVAITLLVLDIKVPITPLTHPTVSLASELAAQWPVYVGFITSFLTILVMWMNHHRMFTLIKRIDDRFLILNGFLLLLVSVVPFSTSLVATYLTHPQAKVAALVYSGTYICLALGFNAAWFYAAKGGRLLAEEFDEHVARGITVSYRNGPIWYFITFVVACFNVTASLALCMLLALYYTLPPRRHSHRYAEHKKPSN